MPGDRHEDKLIAAQEERPAMNYDQVRDAEQLSMLDASIDDFIARFKASPGIGNGKRHTLFLFPGGLASKLKRATTPFVDGVSAPGDFQYKTFWLTLDSFVGGAVDLALTKDNNGIYRDSENRIVVADGAVDLHGALAFAEEIGDLVEGIDLSPYAGFIEWCGTKGLDYFVFGWDWRRRMQDSGQFFVGPFLSRFSTRVQAACGVDPLENFSLVGHSAGGMVVNWILRSEHANTQNLRRAITVGTPFYGYAGQVHRWFEGEQYFNGPLDLFKQNIIRMICTLPACYAWQFMGKQTYDDNQQAFAADAFPLLAYPSIDSTNPAQAADPYDPQNNAGGTRYRTDTGFSTAELANAEQFVRDLVEPLKPALAEKFLNIRGIKPQPDTPGSTRWGFVPPDDPSPIQDGPAVPGDGVQPAWTARLLGLPNVTSLQNIDLGHALMMNSAMTQAAIGNALGI
jgi:hypothetical protein